MKTIKNQYNEPLFSSNILNIYFEGLKVGVIDIETTGLHAEKNQMILGGIAFADFKNNQIKTLQYFAESKEEEQSVLEAYCAMLRRFDLLISYNGEHFDFPFFQKRLKATHSSGFSFSPCQSLDLYRALNKHSHLRQILPNLKQKTVESFMGLWATRTDEISGAESVALYETYVKTGEKGLEDLILLHNEDDLLQLTRLLAVTGKIDFHKVMFYNGFPILHCGKMAYVEKIKLHKYHTEVFGILNHVPMNCKWYEEDYEFCSSSETKGFSLKLMTLSQSNSLDENGVMEYGQINKQIRDCFKKILSKL